MKMYVLLLIMGMGISSVLFAENMSGYSAEWLSHQSSLIATAIPASVEEIEGEGDIIFIKTRFKITELYKGPLSEGDTVSVFNLIYTPAKALLLKDAVEQKKTLLIFCSIADNTATEIDGKFAFTVYHEFSSVYDIDQPIENLYTPEFNLLTKYSELLRRIKAQIQQEKQFKKQYQEMKVVRKSVEVPIGTAAQEKLYAGSSCYIWIPEYQRTDTPDSNI